MVASEMPGYSNSDLRRGNLPDSKNRANLRSATPAGFARAMFEANRMVAN